MNGLSVAQIEQKAQPKIQQVSLKWTDNPSVQKLLDAIAAIIAEEYIQIAKQNKDVFLDSSVPSAPQNDNMGGVKCE